MIELHFEFKAERDYVHGSDIFNAISRVATQSFSGGFVTHIAFRNIARRQCTLAFENLTSLTALATGAIRACDGRLEPFWLFDREEEVLGRYAFDEEAIVGSAEICADEKSINLLQNGAATPIEYVIALTKRLSYRLAPDIDGRWLFGQLNLDVPLNASGVLRIFQKSILHGRMSINEIWLDDTRVGIIRFVVGNP